MADADSCVSKMEKRYLWVPTSPESTTVLYSRNTREGHAGRLATPTSPHPWR
jgi:hypothetical protein